MNDGISFEEACKVQNALTEAQRANCPGVTTSKEYIHSTLIIGGILVLVVVAYWAYRWAKRKK